MIVKILYFCAFFFSIALVILDPLHFHVDFMFCLSITKKKVSKIVSKLYINLERMDVIKYQLFRSAHVVLMYINLGIEFLSVILCIFQF